MYGGQEMQGVVHTIDPRLYQKMHFTMSTRLFSHNIITPRPGLSYRRPTLCGRRATQSINLSYYRYTYTVFSSPHTDHEGILFHREVCTVGAYDCVCLWVGGNIRVRGLLYIYPTQPCILGNSRGLPVIFTGD